MALDPQHALAQLEHDYKAYHHGSAERRADSRALAGAVSEARHAVEGLHGTTAPELQHLRGKLLVQTELADGTLKDPSTLRR